MTRRHQLEQALSLLAPTLPQWEKQAVLDHAQDSPGLRRGSVQAAAWLSLVALARHHFTDYDALLEDGYSRDAARSMVCGQLNAVLLSWGCRRTVGEDDPAWSADISPSRSSRPE
ncbi:DUF2293 domain-containing protein [Haematospirillum sp. 15-248]|uniref:DUF2293 domain-containing protein n=1 Tax=Haematospirillum sp. 15-248 TaxID=2723107 RepID=UPI00143BC5E1|nr:DUF2293 domain-containing protein [Haematospirillum sp. 15-248]NKD87677.1 DUF2293 domain-containing protein [Haematospirillum sp. 15-248]